MVEFEESLQQCYLFIKLLVEVRRAELLRRVLAGEYTAILEGPCGFSF